MRWPGGKSCTVWRTGTAYRATGTPLEFEEPA
jgi:hypothetical protein